jgi:hypothetical protein
VWETLTSADLLAEIARRKVIAGGIGSESLYLHTRHTNQDGKARTTIYRRIGMDKLSDGKLNPAPWARLDRQFLIKLPGEDKPARAASNKPEHGINEVALIAKLAQDMGLLRDEDEKTSERGVDELMRRAMRIATLGLSRHGRRAKIAYALNPKCPGIPTTGGDLKTITRGDKEHIRFLTNALFDWYSLASDGDWDGTDARNLWNYHIASLLGGFLPAELPSGGETVKRSRQQKRKEDETLRDSKLQPIAEYLCKADPSVTLNMYDAWKKHWEGADGKHAVVPKVPDGQKGPAKTTVTKAATGWHAQIRLLTNWVMGRGLPGINKEDAGWKQNVGGLSLKRIATMRSLYQLHKAFNMRPRPCRILGAPKLGETNKGTAQSVLDAMEQMREQRVKQLASRITEAALGIGSEDRNHWEEGTKRPRKRLFWKDTEGNEYGDRRFKPCEAIIIENLRNYRPDEMMARRETRGLMNWCSGKVRKYLQEACQLHGLHLREVQAGYTSRQDSRTGAPGIRCDDVPVSDFLSRRWWIKAIEEARDRENNSSKDRPNTKYHEYLRTLAAACERLDDEARKIAPPVRLPVKGGELFVSADPLSPTAKGLQADLNAAANIGLKALMDPDWSGKWWFVPGSLDGEGWRVPAPKSCDGATWTIHWKLGQLDKGYGTNGKPLQLADDEGVRKTAEILKQARASLDEAEKLLKIARKAKREAEIEAATMFVGERKIAHDDAKKSLATAKKGALAKPIANLWRDPVSLDAEHFPDGDPWLEYAAYKQQIEYHVINNVLSRRV